MCALHAFKMTLLTLGQLARLQPATPFNEVKWLSIPRVRRRFVDRGAFPVAIIHCAGDMPAMVDHMTVGLVVGYSYSPDIRDTRILVKVNADFDPVVVRNRAPASRGLYFMCGLPVDTALFTDAAQINAMVVHAQTFDHTMPPDPRGFPSPLENVPGAPFYFTSRWYDDDESSESSSQSWYDSDSADEEGDEGGDSPPARNVRRRITAFPADGAGGV